MHKLTSVVGYSSKPSELGAQLGVPDLEFLIQRFIQDQLQRNDYDSSSSDDFLDEADVSISERMKVHPIKVARSYFYAPSDPSGKHGLRREYIRADRNWRHSQTRLDCVFLSTDPDIPGMRGMEVARVHMFLAFSHMRKSYSAAVVHRFRREEQIDPITGMWIVEKGYNEDGAADFDVVSSECIVRAAHLLPVLDKNPVPNDLVFWQSLDRYERFFVNKYVDHHAFELLHEKYGEEAS